MKTYLLNKYNSLTETTFSDFKTEFTKNMPVFNTRPGLPIWQQIDEGFWVAERNSITLFADDGSVHTIGLKYDKSYYDTYSILSRTINGLRTLIPQVCEELTLESENHSSGEPVGSKIYYLKFAAPNDEFGRPNMFRYAFLKEAYDKQTIVDYLDQYTAVIKALKDSGSLFPQSAIKFNHLYQDSVGVYLGLCDKFTLPINEAIDLYYTEILISGRYSPIMFQENYDELQQYVREKWEALKI